MRRKPVFSSGAEVSFGEDEVPEGTSAYDVTYRFQSTFGAHANLHSLSSYINHDKSVWTINPSPVSLLAPAAHTPALHTALLAKYVFKTFGLPFDGVEAVGEALLAL